MAGSLHPVDVGVGDKEAVAVPQGDEDALQHVTDTLVAVLQVVGLHCGGVHQKQADGIGPEHGHRLGGVGVVPQALGHLLAVGGKDKAVYHTVLEGGTVKEGGCQNGEGVEPASGLVQSLGDEVRREVAFQVVLVLEGIVVLGVGHGARLKPAVQHLRDAGHGAAAVTGNGNLVHKVLVEVFWIHAGQLLEFLAASHAVGLATVGTLPHRDGVAPVAVAADGPVTGPLQPLSEAAVLDVVGLPVDLLVGRHHLVPDVLHLHEPAAHGTVDEGAGTAPAEGIGVKDLIPLYKLSFSFKSINNVLVTILYTAALVISHFISEPALIVDGANSWNTSSLEHLVIILAKAGGRMDNARSIFCGNKVPIQHTEGTN